MPDSTHLSEWVQAGVRIVSASFGANQYPSAMDFEKSAIDSLRTAGILFVAAAGNGARRLPAECGCHAAAPASPALCMHACCPSLRVCLPSGKTLHLALHPLHHQQMGKIWMPSSSPLARSPTQPATTLTTSFLVGHKLLPCLHGL